MLNIFTLILTLFLSFVLPSACSAEGKFANKEDDQSAKWNMLKNRALDMAICQKLESQVKEPQDPANTSKYKDIASIQKQFIAPIFAETLGVPYQYRSLEHIPIPSIESLECKRVVEIWRAMYEYKTIPYKDVERSPLNDFFMGLIDALKKIFNSTLLALLVVAVFGIGSYIFYSTIKLTKKGSDYSLIGFVSVCFFPISPIAIAPLYFLWTVVLGNSASLLSYFYGCLIFVCALTATYVTRKYM